MNIQPHFSRLIQLEGLSNIGFSVNEGSGEPAYLLIGDHDPQHKSNAIIPYEMSSRKKETAKNSGAFIFHSDGTIRCISGPEDFLSANTRQPVQNRLLNDMFTFQEELQKPAPEAINTLFSNVAEELGDFKNILDVKY